MFSAGLAPAADRVTLTGTVTNREGQPLDEATVLVYRAGVKKGYSLYCPTCYADCGKRTITDKAGRFTIQNLAPDLRVDLVVVRDGYVPTFIAKVDPENGAVKSAVDTRPAPPNPEGLVRGRIVDRSGIPARYAVVEPEGVSGIMIDGYGPVTWYGQRPELDPVAVANQRGEFEISYAGPAKALLLRIQPRGSAPLVVGVSPGPERKTIAVSDGATVRGRLVDLCKPVSRAEIGLIGRPRAGYSNDLAVTGKPHREFRIGTDSDGRFVITDVPAPADWYIYAKMESIAARGAVAPVECSTKRDGEKVDVGDLRIGRGHRLAGRVVLRDGSRIPLDMRIMISAERAWDSQIAVLDSMGRFEFRGLSAEKFEVLLSVRGHSSDPVPVTMDRDIGDLEIKVDRDPNR